jgi:hypothetical protein
VIFAVYMPMIMATGGNVGSQSAAVIIRSDRHRRGAGKRVARAC